MNKDITRFRMLDAYETTAIWWFHTGHYRKLTVFAIGCTSGFISTWTQLRRALSTHYIGSVQSEAIEWLEEHLRSCTQALPVVCELHLVRFPL